MHGPADALEYGVKVTGATLFVVDGGVDTGPIVAQTVVPVPTTTPTRACTSGSRPPSARCSSTPSAGWPATGWSWTADECGSADGFVHRLSAHDWRRWVTTGE